MLQFAKAQALNTDILTSQSFAFFQDDIYLFVIISAQGEDSFNKVKQAAINLESIFYQSDQAVSLKILECFKSLDKELSNNLDNLEVLLVVKNKNLLYIQGKGFHKAYLKRGEKLFLLNKPSNLNYLKEINPTMSQLISGHIQVGDRILLIAHSLQSLLKSNTSQEELEDIMHISINLLEDKLEEIIHNSNSPKAPVSLLMIDFYQDVGELEKGRSKAKLAQKYSLGLRSWPNFFYFSTKKLIPKFRIPKRALYIINIVIVLFLISLFFPLRQSSIKNKEFEVILKSIRANLEKAQFLKETDANEAQKLLGEAKISLKKALIIKPTNPDVLFLEKEIKEKEKQILQEYQIENFSLFLDLNLVKDNFKPTMIKSYSNYFILLDGTSKSLVLLNMKNKALDILAGKLDLGEANFVSMNGDFIFVYSSDKGITRENILAKKPLNIIKKDLNWGEIVDLVGFASNIYLLDSLSGQIWKYVAIEGGYSKFEYLKERSDLLEAKRMMIDGSIWVLKGKGEILKFTQGVKDFFLLPDLEQKIEEIEIFYLSDETENIYLLDKENSRVVVIDKTGKYSYQLTGEKFKQADDFVVDEKDKKLYFLQNNKIYQVELR